MIQDVSAYTLCGSIEKTVEKESTIFSDDAKGYGVLKGYWHSWVKHSIGEYVRDETTTNSIESCWAVLKRSHKGIHHYMSPKHLQLYLNEFTERINCLGLSALDWLERQVRQSVGHRLTYRRLTAPRPPV